MQYVYSKTLQNGHSKIDKAIKILMTNGPLMKVKSIAECSRWSILQYFWPALSDNWSWKPIFGLFESGRFKFTLLHSVWWHWLFPVGTYNIKTMSYPHKCDIMMCIDVDVALSPYAL